MQAIFQNIKGDRLIWAIATLLAIFSFLPVYSAASNLAYTGGSGSTFSYFVKHFMHLFLGFAIMYAVHKIPYRYFRGLSIVMIPIVISYAKIIFGILCLIVGIEFIKAKSENDYLILPLTFLLSFYLIFDLIKYGTSTIHYSGENLLLLILIAFSINRIGITKLAKKLKENKIKIIGILLLGFLPYILAELTYYELYSFLH